MHMNQQRHDRQLRAETLSSRGAGAGLQSRTGRETSSNFVAISAGVDSNATDASTAAALAALALRHSVGHLKRKAAMERAVKELQRSDPAGNALWWDYCERHRKGLRDPCRHQVSFLQKFLADFVAGKARRSLAQAADLQGSYEQMAFETPVADFRQPDQACTSGANVARKPRKNKEGSQWKDAARAAPPMPAMNWKETIEAAQSPPVMRNAAANVLDAASPFDPESHMEQVKTLLEAIKLAGLTDTISNLDIARASPQNVHNLELSAMLREVSSVVLSMIGKASAPPTNPTMCSWEPSYSAPQVSPWLRPSPSIAPEVTERQETLLAALLLATQIVKTQARTTSWGEERGEPQAATFISEAPSFGPLHQDAQSYDSETLHFPSMSQAEPRNSLRTVLSRQALPGQAPICSEGHPQSHLESLRSSVAPPNPTSFAAALPPGLVPASNPPVAEPITVPDSPFSLVRMHL